MKRKKKEKSPLKKEHLPSYALTDTALSQRSTHLVSECQPVDRINLCSIYVTCRKGTSIPCRKQKF